MSSLSIEERFTLDAPPSAVWRILIDPERVVQCLPGAELTGQKDESSYEGSMKVSAGPVTVVYRGTATFEEIDEERRYVRVLGRGREKSGSGTVSMTMESRVEERDDGGTAVSVTSDVKVAGKIVRFGRGMIESVSAELFREFTKCLEQQVGGEGSPSEPSREDRHEAEPAPSARGPREPGADGTETRARGVDDKAASEVEAGAGDDGKGAPAAASSESLALLPLLWRSFKRWLRGLLPG